MNETKKVWRFFTPDNYDKEEEFLTEMSRQGWHFKNLRLFIYEFEKGQPVNYTYKLDYKNDRKADISNYTAMYEDCGWEYVFEFPVPVRRGAWEYFRKRTDSGDDQLFTDNQSKIDLLMRIRRTYIAIGIFFVGINMANFTNFLRIAVRGYAGSMIFILVMYALLIFIYVKIFVRISIKINKLRNDRF